MFFQTPESGQLISMGQQTYRLEMTIILTANHWAEPSDVRIRCGILIDQDERAGEDKENGEEKMEMDEKW
jgi:hypothetical protein